MKALIFALLIATFIPLLAVLKIPFTPISSVSHVISGERVNAEISQCKRVSVRRNSGKFKKSSWKTSRYMRVANTGSTSIESRILLTEKLCKKQLGKKVLVLHKKSSNNIGQFYTYSEMFWGIFHLLAILLTILVGLLLQKFTAKIMGAYIVLTILLLTYEFYL